MAPVRYSGILYPVVAMLMELFNMSEKTMVSPRKKRTEAAETGGDGVVLREDGLRPSRRLPVLKSLSRMLTDPNTAENITTVTHQADTKNADKT